MRKAALLFILASFLLLTVGCADPAAEKPAATVSEPVVEAAPAPVANAMVAFSPDSKVEFVGSKVTGSHDGGFKSFSGGVTLGADIASSSVDVVIDTTSMWTDNENLTGHLSGPDFFDVATFPTASFQSSSITANEDGTSTLTGNLNLHGVTKQISFPATITMTDGGFTAQAEFSIQRFDFGIEYAGKADDLIRDGVVIKLDLKSAGADAGDQAATEG